MKDEKQPQILRLVRLPRRANSLRMTNQLLSEFQVEGACLC